MKLADVLPLRRCEFDLVSWEKFSLRIRDLVKADSLLFVSYREHKGDFVGRLTARGFLITRFIRQLWVPLIWGRVSHRGEGCRLTIWFSAPEAAVFLALTLLFTVAVFRDLGPGGVAFPALFAAGNYIGCLHFQDEIKLFLQAAGLEDPVESSGGA